MRQISFAFAVLSLCAGPASAQAVKAGGLTLSGMQVRATPAGVPTSAAYLTIANSGNRPDKLLSASCACARTVMAHRTETKGGLSSMTAAGDVTIPAKGRTVLAPDGLHLMLMGLKAPLKDGASQTLTLRFEHAGAVKARFKVKALIAPEAKPDMANMPGMKH